jgi:dienelactone hydrolase
MIATYYSTMANLLEAFDSSARKYAFHPATRAQFQSWREEVRSVLAEITGLTRMKGCELNPRQLESCHQEGYLREKWLIQVEPGVWMPFYILIPEDGADGSRPCIVAPHGHDGAGKYEVAGRKDLPEVDEVIRRTKADYGVQLVKAGFVVFCPDARGSGERREWMNQGDEPEKLFSSSCTNLNNAAISLGRTLLGMWIWDLLRLVDFIAASERFNSVKIGCCGFSGGGLQSVWLAALDERIDAAVVSGYFHGYRDTLLQNNLCGCNFVPSLWETVDMGDLGALIAPKPLLIESGSDDPLNGPRGLTSVREQVAITRSAYQLMGETEKLYHHIFQGKHEWNGKPTAGFFHRWLDAPQSAKD